LTLSVDRLEYLAQIADRAVKSYRGVDDWDDIRQEARLAVIVAARKYEAGWKNEYAIEALANWVAKRAVQGYLRSTRAVTPYYRSHAKDFQMPTVVSLTQLRRVNDFVSTEDPVELDVKVEDFSDAVIDRLHSREMWYVLKASCTERQFKVICDRIVLNRPFKEIAEEQGVSVSRINQLLQDGLDHYRELVGAPLKGWKYRGRKERGTA
jgi:RNA polymerase sigma factor (sigma-70 family)